MSADETLDNFNLSELTAVIVSAYVSNNSVPLTELPKIINEVHAALFGLQSGSIVEAVATIERQRPAVSIKRSVTPDYLISLEDGKPYRALKRHLTRLGISPAEYRDKWGLPIDYPMVAPNYAVQRSELAKRSGLGRNPSMQAVVPAPESEPKPGSAPELEPAPAPKKPGRKPKVSSSAS